MTAAQVRYIRTEMAIAAAINAVLSVVFLLIVFGWRGPVPVGGWHGLVVDSVPQSLMIALMSTLVPTLLTRRRVAAGTIAPLPDSHRWPRNVAVRSVGIAVAVAVVAGLLHAVLLPPTGPAWSYVATALYKPVYGALLGAAVARIALVAALRDPTRGVTHCNTGHSSPFG